MHIIFVAFFINIFNYIILYLCAFMLNNIKLILNSIILLLYIYIHLHLWRFKYYLNISCTHLYLYLHIHILLLQESIIDIIRLEIFHSFIINIFFFCYTYDMIFNNKKNVVSNYILLLFF